jgi:hypothetical protein
MNLVETIKSLQKDVQSYKDDNNRLMKAKEEQDGFNIKLLQRLDKLRKIWIRRPSQTNQEDTRLMIREESQEVLTYISITLQDIQLGERAVSQVHLMSGSIRRNLEWTSYKEK